MKRFLMLVGVAVVAAAMYVAASPASQQAKSPTAKQFKALKKQVATLSKTLKTVKAEADATVTIIGSCYLTLSGGTATIVTLPVSQLGNSSDGFLYGTSTASAAPRTALDVNAAAPGEYLQEVNPSCVTGADSLKAGALRADRSRLQLWAKHGR
jgi:hypothetical protein